MASVNTHNITKFRLFSPFRIVIIFIVVATAVWLILPKLMINLLPEAHSNSLDVYFTQPNATPNMLEQQVTSVIEGACSQLRQLKKITSVSRYNNGYIRLEFDRSVDMQEKQLEVAAIVRRVYSRLATNVSYPVIKPVNNSDIMQTPLLVYNVDASLQPYYIRQQVEAFFLKYFLGIDGITEIALSGTPIQQLTIRFDQRKCATYRIHPKAIIQQIQSFSNATYPGSITNEAGQVFFMELKAPAASLSAISNINVSIRKATPIRVKDVAEVYMEEVEPTDYFRINGRNSVSVFFYVRKGINQLVIAERIKARVQQLKQQLPVDYTVGLQYDNTEFLRKEITKNAWRAILSVCFLLLFILISYRSSGYLLNLFASLLVTLCFTILLAWCFNVGIHLYTIAGLAISFGIMMDNTVVMLDHYHHFHNRKIYAALMTATFITIAALAMVFFLPENERNNLADFSLIIILALLSSLVTALCFIPGLYSLTHQYKLIGRTPRKSSKLRTHLAVIRRYYGCIHHLASHRKLFLFGLLYTFGLPFFLMPIRWEGRRWYHMMYNNSFGSSYYHDQLRPIVDKWTGGVLRLFINAINERSSYRSPEKTQLFVTAKLSIGSTPAQMNHILANFEKNLDGIPGIDKYMTRVYSGQRGSIEINFKTEYEQSTIPLQLKNKLIDLTADYAGVEWTVYGVGQGFSSGSGEQLAGYRILMKGYNYDELERQAGVLGELLQQHSRVKKVNTNDRLDYNSLQGMEYLLQLNNEQAALHRVTRNETVEALKIMTKPLGPVMQLLIHNKYYPVAFKEKRADEFSSYDLLHLPIQLDTSRTVSIGSIGKMELGATANSICKENRQYIRAVTFDFTGSSKLAAHYVESTLKKMKYLMPVGYTAERDVQTSDWTRQRRNYLLVGVIILTIFLLCSILFESLKSPFFIITVIPLSYIGLFLTFKIGGFYFDQGGYAAFIMLSGLVANSAVFVVNDFTNLRKKHSLLTTASYNKLIVKATYNRARTILLTTFSTCCGLIPFILEGQHEVFWFSLAIGTIGGLLFSLPVFFIVLPVLIWKKLSI